jgi:CBS domain-containing protein/gamma-glutamylcysteine synthetase
MKGLLNDVLALERMIDEGHIETGVRRIGAEQELCLIDRAGKPAPDAERVLESLNPECFSPELGAFNLEFNLEPTLFGGDCLSRLEAGLSSHLEEAREAAAKWGYEVVMVGILPTMQKTDLGLESMMGRPRYHALNSAMKRLRRGAFELRLIGTDELILQHDSVMLEACNTSCQVHFQVDPEEFARLYNIAQVITAPVLAAAVNSPILFGRRLWRETRIALFQQAVDTRPTGTHVTEKSARVSFGNDWVRESALEIFREDITRFRVVLGIDLEEDPFEKLQRGEAPELEALQLHNSTVYRWNHPCYGVLDGKPTLRIENRALPAGPSVLDEVANAAFWFGLASAFAEEYSDIRTAIGFDNAKNNFLAAARLGLDAQMQWIDGKTIPARELIRNELLPMAREGLEAQGIDAGDMDRFLGAIEGRVTNGRTGSAWLLESFSAMSEEAKLSQKLSALTAASLERQKRNLPVHEWELARLEDAADWKSINHRVEQYMTTELFTVHENEVIDLVASVMDWKHIRHVPVENDDGKLVGIVSYRSLLRLMARSIPNGVAGPIPVSEVMQREIVTASPRTTTLEAIDLMKRKRVACLPVVNEGRLVGIVTERDFLRVAGELLASQLREV